MIRKADVVLTLGCAVALGRSAAGTLRPGAPARVRIDAWFRARATQKFLKKKWATLAASPDRVGAAGSDATAVVFLDFECPYCATQWPALDSALASHRDAAIAIRHFPLGFHASAEGAARAAICAEHEGKFRAMAAELFAHREWRTDHNWSREARSAGINDIGAFMACLRAQATNHRLSEDSVFARELGVSGTPTLVSPDRVVPGMMNQTHLAQLLSKASAHGQ